MLAGSFNQNKRGLCSARDKAEGNYSKCELKIKWSVSVVDLRSNFIL